MHFKFTSRIIACIILAGLWQTSSDGQAPDTSATPASPPTIVTPPADRSTFHIYLLMGQSNMAGRDTRQLALQVDNPRVLALTPDGRWMVARDPLHPKQGRTLPGAGPGIPFAVAMLKADPNITIGLVPCAVGGSALSHWVKGGDYYEKALAMARVAAQSGVISGVLWHQGETDSASQKYADSYGTRLAQMFKDLRQDLGAPNLPILVGQLGGFLDPAKQPFADTVRAAIKNMPAMVPNVGYVDSVGLVDKGDKLHFTADSQKEFGARYAAAMQALQK